MFWMSWKLYRGTRSTEKVLGAVMISGIIAYMIHNAFIFDTSANFIVFFLFAGFLEFQYFQSRPDTIVRSSVLSAMPATMRYSLTALLVLVVSFSVYKTNIIPALANYSMTRGIVASWEKNHPEALVQFGKSLQYNTAISYELRHRYAQYVLENVGSLADQKLDPGKILLATIEEVKKNLASPMDYLPYLYISRAYIILGKNDPSSPYNDLAVENSTKALEISPTFVRTYYEVAQAYLNLKDYDNAINMFKKAAELNPEVGVSWWYLGVTQLDGKDIDGGLASIRKAAEVGYVLSENELVRLIDPLAAVKKYDIVINILEDLVKLQPNNATYFARLSASYAQVGKISLAVAAAKRAAQLDPKSEAEARAFVKEIGG
ncbi:MAG TPA: tetratricopeptide repeat protein, partial [Patescibacteria group bacterium]|nr:tetratricopeptide repeat protein [Patescibacteria group bacterium]